MRVLADLIDNLADDHKLIEPDLFGPSPPEQDSDWALACFKLAQAEQVKPDLVASQLARRWQQAGFKDQFKTVEAVGAYVNFSFRSGFLAAAVSRLAELTAPRPALDQTVLIEYFSINLAKPATVAHLRNLALGRALVNIHRHFGYRVITDNHIGDWGTVFGLWVVGYLKFGQGRDLSDLSVDDLGSFYRQAQAAVADEVAAGSTAQADSLTNQAQAWLLQLQNKDPQALTYHDCFSRISLRAMDRLLDLFGVKFDHTLGEFFYQDQVPGLIDQLLADGLANRQADNSVIVDLNQFKIKTPLLIQKSNGANLYASSDIAALKYRQETFAPDQIIHVVGADQSFYFRQLLAFNQKTNYYRGRISHYAYGLVQEKTASGSVVKMASRRGSLKLDDLIDRAQKTVAALVDPQISPQDQLKISLGALTFLQFRQNHTSNIVFDWQTAFSFQSRSGPYLQYALVRLESILAKAGPGPLTAPADFNDYDWQLEHQLLWQLLNYPDVLDRALAELEPSQVADHCYQLARTFNRYYEKTRILGTPEPVLSYRCWLLTVVRNQLKAGLELLGIAVPEAM